MDWLSDNALLVWIGVALVFAAIEAATVDFVFVMFSLGALGAAGAAALGAPVPVQIVVWLVLGAALLWGLRPLAQRRFMGGGQDPGIGARSLVGREARVVQKVTAVDGRIHLAGETWSARTTDGAPALQPGDEVRVIALSGATAIVVAAASDPPTRPPDPTSPT